MKVEGKRVLITGAARGIGSCLVAEFAKRGCDLILVDKDLLELEERVIKISSIYKNIDVHYFDIDISKTDRLETLQKNLINRDLLPEILVNNAGIGHQGNLIDLSMNDWDRLIDVNLKAPIAMTKIFLPTMKRKYASPCIVNVASGQAFFKLPTWGAYTTTKVALAAFSELLSIEELMNVQVLTVYPFMVDTGFYDVVKKNASSFGSKMAMKLIPYYSNKPETVAKKIVRAIEKDKMVEMVHPINWVGYYLDTLPFVGNITRLITYHLLKSQ